MFRFLGHIYILEKKGCVSRLGDNLIMNYVKFYASLLKLRLCWIVQHSMYKVYKKSIYKVLYRDMKENK